MASGPHELFSGLTRGVPGVRPEEMRPPEAQFIDPADIMAARSLRYSPDKLFCGVIGATILKDPVSGQRFAQGGQLVGIGDDRHAITVAGSRAGKGRAAIVPNMLRYAGSVIAIDPKGELALTTARVRAEQLGQRVCVIDPFGTTDGKLAALETGFNPLAQMDEPKPNEDQKRQNARIEAAGLIADALVVPGSGDPHWDESARAFIEGVILHVATAPAFAGARSLVTVRDQIAGGDLLNENEEQDDTSLEAMMAMSAEPAVQRAGADFFGRPERERGSVASTTRRHLRPLGFPEIAASLAGDGPDLADLKRSPMTVYLCLPGRHMGTCGRWLRLFVNLALQAMETTTAPPATGCPVLFVLDEFAALGPMRQIEDAAGQIAGYGVKLWPILQDLGQLKALYKDRWETFMGNAGVLQFFGNNDLTTLEWVSKRLGTTTLMQRSRSSSDVTPKAQEGGARGRNESLAPHTTAMMEPHEIALTFGRADPLLRALIIYADYGPMILQRAWYDQHEAFASLRAG